MHEGMQYDSIQGQGQGHEPFTFGNPAILKAISSAIYNRPLILKRQYNI